LGILVLKSHGIFPEAHWYWIGVAALVGYTFLFNIIITFALQYLDRKYHHSYALCVLIFGLIDLKPGLMLQHLGSLRRYCPKKASLIEMATQMESSLSYYQEEIGLLVSLSVQLPFTFLFYILHMLYSSTACLQ
jgi:hypothetical protein